MALNGSGQFNLPTGNPVVSGTTISSTVHNNTMDEIATALSKAIFKDGQQTITADIPFNSNKITGLGAATVGGDAVRKDQVNIVDPPNATDSGTDVFEVDLGYDIATEETFVADFGSANTTATPTLENTGGTPSGAQSIVDVDGNARIGMLQARPHRFQWDGTNYVVLDPNTLQTAPSSTDVTLAFDTWRNPNANRPTLVSAEARTQTDGTTAGIVLVQVDESGGTTSDYTLRLAYTHEANNANTFTTDALSFYVPAGGAYQIDNAADPSGGNRMEKIREFTL